MITLEELKKLNKYREMSVEDLCKIINNKLSWQDYNKLPGYFSGDKAKILKKEWDKKTTYKKELRKRLKKQICHRWLISDIIVEILIKRIVRLNNKYYG